MDLVGGNMGVDHYLGPRVGPPLGSETGAETGAETGSAEIPDYITV